MSARGVAPGGPGVAPRWTSSAKSGVGTAADARSAVWYTVSHGILNEVYYPRIDRANVRDMELIVTAGPDFFAEEKRHTDTAIRMIESGVPGFVITNTCRRGRFRIEKTVLTDPDRDVLLQATTFVPLRGTVNDYRLFVLLAPHIGNQGECNTAWIGEYKGAPMLFAERDGTTLALGCSNGFAEMSCGFVGVNDGWQQLAHHGRLTECYARAEQGNVAVTAEVDLSQCPDGFVVALGFGGDADEAGHAVRASLVTSFKDAQRRFVSGWREVHRQARGSGLKASTAADVRASATILRVHEDKVRRGAFIASLSVPWGNARGDHDLGGYHVVWPRDLVEIAGGLLAAGHTDAAREAFHYLMTTQEADGHWPQNMWLDGRAYWPGDQLDETAFPILLADRLRRHRALGELDAWPTVRRAASYLVRTGPVTEEDRWEEDGGYSTFTLAVEIAALLAAADFADAADDHLAAKYLRDTADVWYDALDRWTYATDTELARKVGVEGYYVRIAPPNEAAGGRVIPVRNHGDRADDVRYTAMVSPDALALVRFGLRDANDPRMLNTIRVVDHLLCTDTRNGPTWHRYNNDGYGEHADGAPFDGTGIGRGWPLLTGERAHYELAAGHLDRAKHLLDAMGRQTGLGGLLPEQIWDADDIPDHCLFNGCPTGSAMPLAWAHAERVKLQRSLSDGRVFDLPPQTAKRYAKRKQRPRRTALWRYNNRLRTMDAGSSLRIDVLAPAVVHWTTDDWQTAHDVQADDTSLGVWTIDLPTDLLPAGGVVRFTFYWSEADRWEGQDFAVYCT